MDECDATVKVACLSKLSDLEGIAAKSGTHLATWTRNFALRHTLNGLGIWLAQKVVKHLVSRHELVWDLQEDYEVEAILDYATETKEGEKVDLYLIKWAGWTYQHATWEPRAHLDCPELLEEFHRLQDAGKTTQEIARALAALSKRENFNRCKQKMDDIYYKLRDEKIATGKIFDIARSLSKRKAEQLEMPANKRRKPSTRQNSTITNKRSKAYRILKDERDKALKQWEQMMNEVDKNQAPITVENDVDLDGPPDSFVYINDYRAGEGVVIPKDPIVGCECSNCHEEKANCCGPSAGGEFAYYKNRRVRVVPGTPIYECNSLCACGPECPNRVVQFGRKHRVCLFKTANGRGWGVKAMQKIKKGSFVAEYVGEVITNEEAERRGRIYDGAGRTYLFDLDYNEDDCPFTVDAGRYGNISHFINHSCDPNLAVYGIWINTLDLRLPRIALFAQRDIAKGEELTFDYMMTGETTGGLSAHANASFVMEDQEDVTDMTQSSTESFEVNNSDLPVSTKDSCSVDVSSDLPGAPDDMTSVHSQEDDDPEVTFLKPTDMTSLSALEVKTTTVQEMPPTPPPSEIFDESLKTAQQAKPAPSTKYRVLCQCGAKVCRGYLY